MRGADFALLHGWFSDPVFVKWWGGVPKTAEEVAQKYLGHRPDVQSFIIEHGGEPAGYIQYWKAGHAHEGIDIVLVPDLQGKGIGVTAVRLLVQRLQADGCTRITVDPNPKNTAAVRAFQKAGFIISSEDVDGEHITMDYVG